MTLSVGLDTFLDTPHTHGTLAGLPQWLRMTEGPAAILAVGGPDWPDRLYAALQRRPRAILLSEPGPADPGVVRELADLADSLDVPVVLESPWASHPAVTTAASGIQAALAETAIIELFAATDDPPTTVLLNQLALLRTAVGRPDSLPVHRLDADGHSATTAVSDVPVRLTGVRCAFGAADARLVLRGAITQWRVNFGDPRTARPAAVRRIDAEGEHLLPTHYETAHRTAWRHTYAAATAGGTEVNPLRALAADLTLLPAEALTV